jgi:hypothetical protein
MQRLCKAFVFIAIILSVLPSFVFSGTVAELRYQIDVSRPQSQDLGLVHGETVDVSFRAVQYSAPLDLSGATVIFHARTNGMPLNTSYQVTGSVGRAGSTNEATNGWASARIVVDQHLPNVSTMSYTLLVSGASGDLCRISGPLKITGTSAGSTSTAVATLIADPYGAAAAVSNALASALAAETLRAQQAESAAQTTANAACTTGGAAVVSAAAAQLTANAACTTGGTALAAAQAAQTTADVAKTNLTSYIDGLHVIALTNWQAFLTAVAVGSSNYTDAIRLAITNDPRVVNALTNAAAFATAAQGVAATNALAQAQAALPLAGGTMAGNLDMGGTRSVTNVWSVVFTDTTTYAPKNLGPCALYDFQGELYYYTAVESKTSLLYTSENFLVGDDYLAPDGDGSALQGVEMAGVAAGLVAGYSNAVSNAVAMANSALQPAGSGAALTGITAAQVGAVSNNAAGIAAAGGVTTNSFTAQLTITYSNNMIYFNAPLNTITGMVFNIGGSNILMKAVN